MERFRHQATHGGRGFLGRLRRDVRGNTLAMMAAFLIPMVGLAGSAVDVARLYVVKVRLQQACDAGVLAGRKVMANDGVSTLDDSATTQAGLFFSNNFKTGWMGTSAVSFTPSNGAANIVNGTANATVPMTLMKFFGMPDRPLSVACEAEYDVADADIMFVLDTTGSMGCLASDNQSTCDSYASSTQTVVNGRRQVVEKSGSRIAALRTAVDDFYKTLNDPTVKDASTHLRFGFVPYSTTVNVGRIIPQAYMATSAPYQTRVLQTPNADTNSGSPATSSTTGVTQTTCNPRVYRTPSTTNTYNSSGQAVISTITWTQNTSGDKTKGTCKQSDQTVVPTWVYKQATLDTSKFITGAATTIPTMPNGATDTWEGCIEERKSQNVASFDASNLPDDLDPDLTPTSLNPDTQWKPMWFDVQYDRKTDNETTLTAGRLPTDRLYGSSFVGASSLAWPYNALACPKQAQRLKEMTESDIKAYVNASDFVPYGLTYHDIGMIWGTRFLSSTGPFASDTSTWPGHNQPNRVIVFLTDGAMENYNFAYDAYGMERLDKRVTTDGSSNLVDRHNARFLAACQAAKNRNITVFVVAYAQTLTTQLQSCATPGDAYSASSDADLDTKFKQIAAQVAMLRVSK